MRTKKKLIWALIQAAQSVCQSRNGSNPAATKTVHEDACDRLEEALGAVLAKKKRKAKGKA